MLDILSFACHCLHCRKYPRSSHIVLEENFLRRSIWKVPAVRFGLLGWKKLVTECCCNLAGKSLPKLITSENDTFWFSSTMRNLVLMFQSSTRIAARKQHAICSWMTMLRDEKETRILWKFWRLNLVVKWMATLRQVSITTIWDMLSIREPTQATNREIIGTMNSLLIQRTSSTIAVSQFTHSWRFLFEKNVSIDLLLPVLYTPMHQFLKFECKFLHHTFKLHCVWKLVANRNPQIRSRKHHEIKA